MYMNRMLLNFIVNSRFLERPQLHYDIFVNPPSTYTMIFFNMWP